MLPSQVLIVARSEKSYASYLPDGFATFIRFNFRAGEGIGTLPLGGRLGTGMSRTLILLGLILVAVGLLWRWSGPLRLGRLPGDIVVEHVHS